MPGSRGGLVRRVHALSKGEQLKPIELFDRWLLVAAESALTLSEWAASPWNEKADAYALYRAALNREEQAARALADRVEIAARAA
jgi:hypothetical protein